MPVFLVVWYILKHTHGLSQCLLQSLWYCLVGLYHRQLAVQDRDKLHGFVILCLVAQLLDALFRS